MAIAPRYPEHEKLSAIADESNAIGAFLDLGLPKLGLALYERVARDCECKACTEKQPDLSGWHTEAERETVKDGRVQITEWVPTRKVITAILADHFGIDQDKIDREKEQMLADIRGGS